jgi:hypothetical protein
LTECGPAEGVGVDDRHLVEQSIETSNKLEEIRPGRDLPQCIIHLLALTRKIDSHSRNHDVVLELGDPRRLNG